MNSICPFKFNSQLIGQLVIISIVSLCCSAQQQVMQQQQLGQLAPIPQQMTIPIQQQPQIQQVQIQQQQIQPQPQQIIVMQQPATIPTPFVQPSSDGMNVMARNAAQTALIQAVSDSPISGSSDEVCGLNLKELRHDVRIVGGRAALPSEVPFIVHLRESHVFRMLGYNKCGGVLINHSWAITAAHCKPAFFSSLEIILGKHKTFEDAPPPEGSAIAAIIKSGKGIFGNSKGKSPSSSDSSENDISSNPMRSSGRRQPILQILAEKVIVHPDYDSKTLENDLALIKMKKPVPFRDDIQPVCMPRLGEDFTGLDGYATGWGLTDFDKRQLPETLQIVRLPIIGNRRCQSMYKKAGHDKQITEMDLCAGYAKGGMDACEGDSGGPLLVHRPHDRRWVLAGIVSNGVKCGEPLLPGVYTRVSKFMNWIEEQMRIHS